MTKEALIPLEVDRAALTLFLDENQDKKFEMVGNWCVECPFAQFVRTWMSKPTFRAGYSTGTEDGSNGPDTIRYELPEWVTKFINNVDDLRYDERTGANALIILKAIPNA